MATIGYKDIEIRLHTNYDEEDINRKIRRMLHIREFKYDIVKKSLDARRKPDVYWLLRLRVISKEIRHTLFAPESSLEIPFQSRKEKVIVVGSGPAGFFAAFVLTKAGFRVTLLEKGPPVKERFNDIIQFEKGGAFKSHSNYCHGEGGAGTFSDGKLTSRTKGIAPEKQFVFESYINAGAPEEIKYMAMPHIGSDNLRVVIPNLRRQFEDLGGKILFNTEVIGLEIKDQKCTGVFTADDFIPGDMVIVAPGHSSYATYRMLYKNGIRFRTKPFAVGVRVEHPQELINKSQWRLPLLPGVKAADYKLTFSPAGGLPVYSFCMCPGGKVIPSAPEACQNIVNGVSDYARNSPWANSAIVAGLDLNALLGKPAGIEESLSWLETLERKAYNLTNSFQIPACKIEDFINHKVSGSIPKNSYPFGTFSYDFQQLLPQPVIESLRIGMVNFTRKIKGFETGIMLGIETKTSAPVQVIRDEQRRCEGFENIFIAGEGSGYTGGITSSAVDGVKVAMGIVGEDH
nr:NAD(P)/FAD-dependent oxidoreductase [Bacteroidota bacterium]